MSRLLNRLSTLSSLRKDSAIRQEMRRSFSSSLTTPYMTVGDTVKGESPEGDEIRDVLFFDPAKEELLTVPDKTFPEELIHSRHIGSSHGWGIFSNDRDPSLCMSDIYTSKSNPKVIPLPNFVPLFPNQAEVVWNVAMSSSSPCDEDCVVAVKFLGKQLSLYRPNNSHWPRWTNIQVVPAESCVKLDCSNLMFSKRDQRFYLPAPGGNELYSWDLNLKKNKPPELHELVFRDLPELPESEWGLLGVCCRKEHLVESSSSSGSDDDGERFLVKCYVLGYLRSGKLYHAVRRFMVFREEETTQRRYMCYTEDIGDVCIFLSKSEAFCVQASSCPGLKPNSIYYIGSGFGVYSLADNTSHHFKVRQGETTSFKDLYWFPPSCL